MAHDLQLDLDVLIPDAHDQSDRCVSELITVLKATDGVEDVHIIDPSDESPARLCVSIESGRVSVKRLAQKARSAGAEISARYGHAAWQLRGVTHSTRAANAQKILRTLPGVIDAVVTTGGRSRIEFDHRTTSEADLKRQAIEAGLTIDTTTSGPDTATASDHAGPDHLTADDADHSHDGAAHAHGEVPHGHDHAHEHSHGGMSELAIAAAAFTTYVVARIIDWVGDSDRVPLVLYVVVAVVTGVMVGRDMLATFRARRLDIEMLMIAAAIGAAALGNWSDSALLLALFSLGHGLESFAMERARNEIESLADLAPPIAHRKNGDGTVDDVDPEELAIGDVLVIKPNERIPADGIVTSGYSTVDESPVTGESIPVEKSPVTTPSVSGDFDAMPGAHRVFAGTLNGPQALEVTVARTSEDSTLARVIKLVAEAETQISPTQRLTQRIVRVFVPSVLALVALTLVVPLVFGAEFRPTFMRAMAMLVASSPCALAIAIPSAVLSAIARAAREGVLIKGGGPLEVMGQVCVVAFDKTGTLTSGQPKLVAVEPEIGVTNYELLSIAIAVERLSDHPLARAIVTGAPGFMTVAEPPGGGASEASGGTAPTRFPVASEVTAEVGRGVTALVDERRVSIGNAAMSEGASLSDHLGRRWVELEESGATTMLVCREGTPIGLLGVTDSIRPEARATVAQLRSLGIHHTIMLSGDHQRVADAVARHVGVDEASGGLLPEDKVAAVRELAAQHSRGIAMVGDGVNDAPALGAANVGIAMGAAGSAVALETADIALMGDRLDRLPFTVRLARRATRTILQNLVISLGMVAILIPLTLAGIGIGPAVIAHEGSTLVVVANALRLLAHRDRDQG